MKEIEKITEIVFSKFDCITNDPYHIDPYVLASDVAKAISSRFGTKPLKVEWPEEVKHWNGCNVMAEVGMGCDCGAEQANNMLSACKEAFDKAKGGE